jgi:NAD(P)H-nitrite reductase large subunit
MEEDIEICNCLGIMKSEIVKAIKDKGLQTLEEVQDETNAGTVCGTCIPDIEDILKEINN